MVSFRFSVTSRTAAYTAKAPRGVPMQLERISNRADQLMATIYEEDTADPVGDVDLDVVEYGDIVELFMTDSDAGLNDDTVFYGEVISKQWIRESGNDRLKVVCVDFLRDGMRQLNRIVFNGYLHGSEEIVEDDFTTPLQFAVRPIARVQRYNPHGVYEIDNTLNTGDDEGEVSNDGTTNRQVGYVFPARDEIITAMHFMPWDPEAKALLGNTNVNYADFIVLLVHTQNRTIAGDDFIIPRILKIVQTRDGEDARFFIGNKAKEGWKEAATVGSPSLPIIYTSGNISNSNLTWAVVRTGTSQVEIRDSGIGREGFFARINHNGGDSASITTTSIRTINLIHTVRNSINVEIPSSGWNCFQMKFSTTGAIGAHLQIFIDDDSSDVEAASIDITSGNMTLNYGDGLTNEFVTGLSITETYNFYFKFNFRKMMFDFFYGIQTGGGKDTAWFDIGRNLEILNKDTFTNTPNKSVKWVMSTDGAASGNFDIGWVNANEICDFGNKYEAANGRWARVLFDDDPALTTPGQSYAMVLLTDQSEDFLGATQTTRDKFFVAQLDILVQRYAPPGFSFLRFDGTWVREGSSSQQIGDYAIVVEDSRSWEEIEPGNGFTIDYENKQLIWDVGAAAARRPVLSSIFIDQLGDGANVFKNVKIDEYFNPSSNILGIIVDQLHTSYTAHKMTVADVVQFIAQSVTNWDTDVIFDGTTFASTIGSGFHDDTTSELPVYLITQSNVLEVLRDLASQFSAMFYISADSTKQLHFDATTTITDIADPPVGVHDYMVSTLTTAADNQQRIISNTIGRIEDDLFTTFTAIGATPDLRAITFNDTLFDSIGKVLERKPEIFRKEVDLDRLYQYTEMLLELFGVERFEGTVTVDGYFPVDANNRLDVNGRMRVQDPIVENGSLGGGEGTGNVFKVVAARYSGEDHITELDVTSRIINRTGIEQRLEELRILLNGTDPTDPERDIDRHVNATASTVNTTTFAIVYMALFDTNDEELVVPGYTRQVCHLREFTIEGTDYAAYSTTFFEDTGTIETDNVPIKYVELRDAETAGSVVTGFSKIDFSTLDFVYKWENRKFNITVTVTAS